MPTAAPPRQCSLNLREAKGRRSILRFFSFQSFCFQKRDLGSFLFFRGKRGVLFAAVSDRSFSFSYVLSPDLPGHCITLMQSCLRTIPGRRWPMAPVPHDRSPLPVGAWAWFWKGCAMGCMKAYLTKGANTRKNVYKANIFVMFGDLPSRSSFKHEK